MQVGHVKDCLACPARRPVLALANPTSKRLIELISQRHPRFAIAELGASQNQIGQKLGEVLREVNAGHESLTMGLEAATSAIAELSRRHAA